MSIKKVCDRCNKVKEGNESFAHIDYMVGNDHSILDYDLCPGCAKLFEMFINGGTVEEDRYKDSKPCAVVIHKLCDTCAHESCKCDVEPCKSCDWRSNWTPKKEVSE